MRKENKHTTYLPKAVTQITTKQTGKQKQFILVLFQNKKRCFSIKEQSISFNSIYMSRYASSIFISNKSHLYRVKRKITWFVGIFGTFTFHIWASLEIAFSNRKDNLWFSKGPGNFMISFGSACLPAWCSYL